MTLRQGMLFTSYARGPTNRIARTLSHHYANNAIPFFLLSSLLTALIESFLDLLILEGFGQLRLFAVSWCLVLWFLILEGKLLVNLLNTLS